MTSQHIDKNQCDHEVKHTTEVMKELFISGLIKSFNNFTACAQ